MAPVYGSPPSGEPEQTPNREPEPGSPEWKEHAAKQREEAARQRVRAQRTARIRRFAPACAAVVALFVIIGGAVVYDQTGNGSSDITVATQPQQIDEDNPVQQTGLQQAEAAFGPFETVPPAATEQPDTKMPAVLELHSNGTLAASEKYTVPFDSMSWIPQASLPQVNAYTVDGDYAQIRSATGKVYTIHTSQPLLFTDYPDRLAMIDSKGQFWLIATDKAQLIRTPLQH